jgi:ribulose-bisphosphate carboxylase large chain
MESGVVSNSRFEVDYCVSLSDNQFIEVVARDIGIEQTVEIPEDCIPETHWKMKIIGVVERIVSVDEMRKKYLVTISYPSDITSYSVTQFLNTLFGNISLKNNIRIDDVRLSQSMMKIFPGPRYGIDGIRALLGVQGRPLTCTALKPVGLSSGDLARMAYQFALGGADLIKDDHGITNQPYSPFEERIARVQDAIDEANTKTGKITIYCPMLNDEPEELKRQIDICVKRNVRGALAAPFLIGAGAFVSLRKNADLVLLAHPALAGTFFHSKDHGATPAFLLGVFFRLIGADVSIFPNAGGRFTFTQEECDNLCMALRIPKENIKSSFPSPAGGMRIERVAEMIRHYGNNTVLLIGGNIQQLNPDVSVGTKLFLNEVEKNSLKE